jgi:hypothetical protein
MQDPNAIPEANIPPEAVENLAGLLAEKAGRNATEATAADRAQALESLRREVRKSGTGDGESDPKSAAP